MALILCWKGRHFFNVSLYKTKKIEMKIKNINPDFIYRAARVIYYTGCKKYEVFRYLPREDAIQSLAVVIAADPFAPPKEMWAKGYRELFPLYKEMLAATRAADFELERSPFSQEDIDFAHKIIEYYTNHTWRETCQHFGLDAGNKSAQKQLSKTAKALGIKKVSSSGKGRGQRVKVTADQYTAAQLRAAGVSRTTVWRFRAQGFAYITQEQNQFLTK